MVNILRNNISALFDAIFAFMDIPIYIDGIGHFTIRGLFYIVLFALIVGSVIGIITTRSGGDQNG